MEQPDVVWSGLCGSCGWETWELRWCLGTFTRLHYT